MNIDRVSQLRIDLHQLWAEMIASNNIEDAKALAKAHNVVSSHLDAQIQLAEEEAA